VIVIENSYSLLVPLLEGPKLIMNMLNRL